MARSYADEHFPLPVVEELRRSGHDVLPIQEDGRAKESFPNEDVLSAAAEFQQAVLTLNRKHFVRMKFESSPHTGIVSRTFGPDFEGQARRIHEAASDHVSLEGEPIPVNRREF